jgi:uncharacterized protein (TIGR02001 family)
VFACGCLCAAAPAAAELGAQVSVFSDTRFRGYSLSESHPVGIVDLSYDDPSGLYAAVSGSALASSGEGIKPLGLQLNTGYAKRLAGMTVDAGVIHSTYSRYSSRGYANSYTELYAGLGYKFLSSRVAFSPHYFEHGVRIVYGELDADLSPARKLHLTGHAGLLVPLDYGDSSESIAAHYDWRIGISREVGHASLHLIGSGGGPGRDYYNGRAHSRNAVIAGVSWAF